MRKLRVLLLVADDCIPPDDPDALSEEQRFRVSTEIDVRTALGRLGHEVQILGVHDELGPIRQVVEGWRPHVVFNLLEEFQGEAVFDQNVVSYLELLRVPHTGCGPRGLVLARDKALAKKIVSYHRVPTPRFFVCRRGRRPRLPRGASFPLIVKSLMEEASLGISLASVVRDEEELAERVALVHARVWTDALVEEFVRGREIYVGVIGNDRKKVLPPFELRLEGAEVGDRFATAKLKHDLAYQKRHGVTVGKARLSEALAARLERLARRTCRALALDGYARLDFRVAEDGTPYFLEANPNPDIAADEEFALAAAKAGLGYDAMIQKILSLALRRAAPAPGG